MRSSSSPIRNSRNATFRDRIQHATAKTGTMSKKSFRDWIEMKNGMLLWALTLYRQLAVDATEPIGSRASRQIQDGLAGRIQEISSCVRVCVQASSACLEPPGS